MGCVGFRIRLQWFHSGSLGLVSWWFEWLLDGRGREGGVISGESKKD